MIDDLGFALDQLQGELDETIFRVDEVESAVADVDGTVETICNEFSFYDGAFFDIWLNAC